jgi:hypothetical protein
MTSTGPNGRWRRVVDLSAGKALIVTDLHGDHDAYTRYRDRFLTLLEQGAAERWILCGDLIHGYGPAHTDASLPMLLDLIALRDRLGPERVILLLGNHELPHLYGLSLSRATRDYTPRFERALSDAGPDVRARVMAFLDSLPFYVRTAAGVMLSHVGASPVAVMAANRDRLAVFDHQQVIREADAWLDGRPLAELKAEYLRLTGCTDYDKEAAYWLGVDSPADPRYRDLLRTMAFSRADSALNLLWEAFFTRNEQGMPLPVYNRVVEQFLATWSAGAPAPQRVIVAGHIPVAGGYQIIGERQLRLASRAHAHPGEAGQYLLLDCAAPVHAPDDLIPHLGSVFEP